MTLTQMVEEVQQVFPEYPRTQIVFELNRAMREFARKTGVYHTYDILLRETDLLTEDTRAEETVFLLPENCYEVNAIDGLLRDQYEVQGGTLRVGYIDIDLDWLTIRYSALPAPLVNPSDTPPFESSFHDAIVHATKKKFYVNAGRAQDAALEDTYLREAEREARRFVHTSPYRNMSAAEATFGTGGSATIVAYGRQDLVQGENTVTIGRTFSSVSNFYLMLNGNGIHVEEFDPNNNFSERTTSSFKVLSAEANNNFEFYAIGT